MQSDCLRDLAQLQFVQLREGKIETLDMFSLFPYFVNRLQPVNSSNLPNTVRYQLDCIAEFINSPFNEDSHEIL